MEDPLTRHTICIRHLVDDLQLHRRQFQIHVIHPGKGNLSRPEIKEELAKKFNISDTQTIFISSFHTTGPFSKGFGILYDSVKDTLQHEPKHRLAQNGLKAHVERSTKASSSRAKKNSRH
jgi:ribosomal protein S24E